MWGAGCIVQVVKLLAMPTGPSKDRNGLDIFEHYRFYDAVKQLLSSETPTD